MVTQTTLADLLIEAGFEPEAALRVTRMIEQDLSDLAKQTEVSFRFDAVEKQIDIRIDGVDTQIKALDSEVNLRFDGVDTRIDDLKDGTERELQGVNQRIDDLKNSTERESRSLGQRITDLRNELTGRFTEHKDGVEQSIAQLKASLEAKIDNQGALLRSEIESLRREHRILTWAIGIGFTLTAAGFGVVITLLIELLNR